MRILILSIFLLPISCKSLTEHEKKKQFLTGNWIVLYPDHQLRNQHQRELYGKLQDSIVGEAGLKLISLEENGQFRQADSLNDTGSWELEENGDLIISGGGKGFNYLKANFLEYNNNELKLMEHVMVGNERIRLVWHWKKIEANNGGNLFEAEDNDWRIKPGKREDNNQIKKRLRAMLTYYSQYYKLVSDEASYFIGDRVLLPFRFYQNAVGLRPFDPLAKFAAFFYDGEDAKKAYDFLDRAMDLIEPGEYPTGKDFVDEYAKVMERLGKEVAKLQ
jgi:hypothetical protein